MQLAKTVGAIQRMHEAGVPYVSVLSDPTTGGVFASFSALGDINLAEPDALIGFAGARVSAGTIAQELPPGFQRAEFLFEHGFVDRVVQRSVLREELIGLLGFLRPAPLAAFDVETVTVPAFRPLSFLSSLAEKMVTEAPEPAAGAAAPGSNGKGARPAAGARAADARSPDARAADARSPDAAGEVRRG